MRQKKKSDETVTETAEQPVETIEAETVESADKKPKTRRRPRRGPRKKSMPVNAEGVAADTAEESGVQASEGIQNKSVAEADDSGSEAAPAAEAGDPDAPREKSRRRRRRRKNKKGAETVTAAAAVPEQADTQDRTKRILIHARFAEEKRVAIIEGNRLMDYYAESSSRVHLKGNIYKAVVEGLVPGLQAAFVDFGRKKRGFLQFREVMPELRKAGGTLEEGQEILVQVDQDERDTKGASLTTFISMPGRYIVMLPGQQKVGVSRKIEDRADRDRLKDTFNSLKLPKDMGFILRTACGDSLEEELDRDLKYLTKLWSRVNTDYKKAKAPKLIYQEQNVTMRALRDYLTSDTLEILIDDAETYKSTKSFLQKIMPWRKVNLIHYTEKAPLFDQYGIEQQVAALANRSVKLPSGGTIVFDKTEALTSIDVNSARSHKEDNIEATALNTNLEAAAEVARQLRLRDIGGLIVIDFIDMRSGKSRTQVEARLKESLAQDKASLDVGPISRFGLLEMTRERLRPALVAAVSKNCPLCGGSGTVFSEEHVSIGAMRELHLLAEKNQGAVLNCRMAVGNANALANSRRAELAQLEQLHKVNVHVIADASLQQGQYHIEVKKHK